MALMAANPKPATRVAILDVADLEVWAEALPGCALYSFHRDNTPAVLPGADVAILRPAENDATGQARLKEIIASLHGTPPFPVRLRLVDSYAEILNEGGKVIAPPRPRVVQLSQEQKRQQAEEAKAKALAPLSLPSLMDIRTAQVEPSVPLFEGIFFPGAWLITGRPKVGKSWLLLQLAIALAERGQFLGRLCQVQEPEVLLILAEDNQERICERLSALGVANAPQNCAVMYREVFKAVAAERSKFQTLEQFLDQYLTDHPRCRLIILDTETNCRQVWLGEAEDTSASKMATKNDYREIAGMDDIALRHKAVIALVNHTSKAKTGPHAAVDPHEMINRTNTALAAASGQLVLTNCPGFEDEEAGKMRQASWRGRDLKDDMNWAIEQGCGDDLPLFTFRGDLGDVIQNQAELQILRAVETIRDEEHTDRYITAAEIAEEIGKSRDAVKRCISRMFKTDQQRFHKGMRVDHKRGATGGIRLMGGKN